ncbi:hypothetical protein DBR42_13605 [Pelomonas sp. HMWF004]|nr:hypothetical protein DBR42_13605 [Pelomonas sp. HMWF004]
MLFDSYVRLGRDELKALSFEHLESCADPAAQDERAEPADACPTAAIEGFTEWVSTAPRPHSIGWDWYVKVPEGTLAVRPFSIRTNIMLRQEDGSDAGQAATLEAIGELIQGWPWAEAVLQRLQPQLCKD